MAVANKFINKQVLLSYRTMCLEHVEKKKLQDVITRTFL